MYTRKLERIPMSMKGSVSNTDVRLELRGPTLLEVASPCTFVAKSQATLLLNFEIRISELSNDNREAIHQLVVGLSEEINRRLS